MRRVYYKLDPHMRLSFQDNTRIEIQDPSVLLFHSVARHLGYACTTPVAFEHTLCHFDVHPEVVLVPSNFHLLYILIHTHQQSLH
jgi:hypothetical protein